MGRCRAGHIAVPAVVGRAVVAAVVAAVIAATIVAGQPALAASVPPGQRLLAHRYHVGVASPGQTGGTAVGRVARARTAPLRVATHALPSGIAGLSYLAVL